MKIIDIKIHPSFELAWVLANCEATLANHDCIRPVHVLLAILKILDNNYSRVIEMLECNEDELRQINDIVASCLPLLHLSESELTAARRSLHKALHDRESDERPLRPRLLKWSGVSRYLYRKSELRAAENGHQSVTLAHLLEELLANLPPEAKPFFKNHPRAQFSIDSGETAERYVKYDSPLWNASEEPD